VLRWVVFKKMKGLLKMQQKTPGVTRGIDSNRTSGDTAIPKALDHTFNRNGRKWRVSCLCDTFVIGTAVDAVLDDKGEPSRESDIIRVML